MGAIYLNGVLYGGGGSGDGQIIQVDTLPEAAALTLDKIYQYIGDTDANYTNGFFYKCIEDNGAYFWTRLDVQPNDGGEFVGTIAEWNALTPEEKAQYTIVNLTDDTTNMSNIVDTVQDGNMSPVTSNAVYDEVQEIKIGISDLSAAVLTKASDANVVHKTGAETIAGDKTFSNDISTSFATIGPNSVGSATPAQVRGDSTEAFIGFTNSNGTTAFGHFGAKNDNKPYFDDTSSVKRLALLDETSKIKLYATLTGSQADSGGVVSLTIPFDDYNGKYNAISVSKLRYDINYGYTFQPSFGFIPIDMFTDISAPILFEYSVDFNNQYVIKQSTRDEIIKIASNNSIGLTLYLGHIKEKAFVYLLRL